MADAKSKFDAAAAKPNMQRITWNGIALHGGPLAKKWRLDLPQDTLTSYGPRPSCGHCRGAGHRDSSNTTQGRRRRRFRSTPSLTNSSGSRPMQLSSSQFFRSRVCDTQYMIGLMTMNGRGVPKDLVQGYAFLVMAGQGGVRSAGRVVQTPALTEAQRGQAQEIIDRWKPKPESSLACSASTGMSGRSWIPRTGRLRRSALSPLRISTRAAGARATLVAPRIVLTAAHCLLNGTELISPGNVHFLAGLNKGTPVSTSAAARFVVAKEFVPTLRDKWTIDRSPADWALVVLKDAVPIRPVVVKALTREELRDAVLAGTISEIGYGQERRFSPTAQRNCRADWGKDNRLLIVQCLANFGYSGSPILADINGIPAVVGVFSAFHEETRVTIAASASQFEAAVRDQIGAEAGPTR
jgi:V8-like Glu-specific endopeptidase